MKNTINPSNVLGVVKAPSSKSMMQRAVAAAILAPGTTTLLNPSFCNDSLAAIDIAKALGATVEVTKEKVVIQGHFAPVSSVLNCGEAGLGVRMFSPLAALYDGQMTLSGEGSLLKRPVDMIEEALVGLGVTCTTNKGFLPLTVHGPLKGGVTTIDGSLSSQTLTGLLMALPVAKQDSLVTVRNLKSKPYIDMTIQLLADFGVTVTHQEYKTFTIKGNQTYTPREYFVEGDWSGASFLLVAGALAGKVTIEGVFKNSTQADIAMLKAVELAGANVEVNDTSVVIERKELNCFDFDATECPDLFPPLVALAAHCKGMSVFKGVSRLKHKESDRATALQQEFAKLNIDIILDGDLMYVQGGVVSGGEIFSHHDHRIAMAGAVTALIAQGPITIDGAESVKKSYPEFYDDLASITL